MEVCIIVFFEICNLEAVCFFFTVFRFHHNSLRVSSDLLLKLLNDWLVILACFGFFFRCWLSSFFTGFCFLWCLDYDLFEDVWLVGACFCHLSDLSFIPVFRDAKSESYKITAVNNKSEVKWVCSIESDMVWASLRAGPEWLAM